MFFGGGGFPGGRMPPGMGGIPFHPGMFGGGGHGHGGGGMQEEVCD